MTVRYRGHHCTQLRLGVFNPVGRDGSPPTLIRVVPRTERERFTSDILRRLTSLTIIFLTLIDFRWGVASLAIILLTQLLKLRSLTCPILYNYIYIYVYIYLSLVILWVFRLVFFPINFFFLFSSFQFLLLRYGDQLLTGCPCCWSGVHHIA